MAAKRIVVGIDGSDESSLALQKAADIAHAMHAELKIVYVVPRHPPPGPAAYAISDEERRDLGEHDHAAALLAQAERTCRRPGLDVITETETGAVAETLADLADEGRADLVVVGHRGHGAVRRALLGSVADRLMQICTRPVLVVR
ncbi:MAG: universal stress protein [Deltaproteobacteria bacterium]|nr:MAG: universal stress protein [Deltaproteobacteria bacterium]